MSAKVSFSPFASSGSLLSWSRSWRNWESMALVSRVRVDVGRTREGNYGEGVLKGSHEESGVWRERTVASVIFSAKWIISL